MQQSRLRDGLILAGAVAVLSTGSIFARLAGLAPDLTAFLRCLFAVILLGGWTAAVRTRLPRGRDLALALGSGACLALHLWSWFAGMGLTSVAMSLALLSTAPVWSLVLGALLGLERPRLAQVPALGLSLAGIGAAAWSLWDGPGRLAGGALSLLSGLAMAGYTLCARARSESCSLEGYVLTSYGAASLLLLPATAASGSIHGPAPFASLAWIGAMALCSQVIGHSTVNWAAGRLGAVTTGQVLLLEPVIASVMAWIVFGERVGPALAAGGGLILAGSVAALASQRSQALKAESA